LKGNTVHFPSEAKILGSCLGLQEDDGHVERRKMCSSGHAEVLPGVDVLRSLDDVIRNALPMCLELRLSGQ